MKIPNLAWSNSLREAIFWADGIYFSCEKIGKDVNNINKAKNTNLGAIKSTMRRLFPEHHPHELRYTFITRCKECGVNPELVMLWDGHEMDDDVKTSKVDRGYTDYSDEYQLQEAEKVNYKIPTETA